VFYFIFFTKGERVLESVFFALEKKKGRNVAFEKWENEQQKYFI